MRVVLQFPSATERLEKTDRGDQVVGASLNERKLSREQVALSI